jgi:hypothetical protein
LFLENGKMAEKLSEEFLKFKLGSFSTFSSYIWMYYQLPKLKKKMGINTHTTQ